MLKRPIGKGVGPFRRRKGPVYHSVHLVADGNSFAKALEIASKSDSRVAIAGPYLDRSRFNETVREGGKRLNLPGLEDHRRSLAHHDNLELALDPAEKLKSINREHGPGAVHWIDAPFSLAGAEDQWARIAKKTGATSHLEQYDFLRWWERPIELTDELAKQAFKALHPKGRLTACVPKEIAGKTVSRLENAGFKTRSHLLEEQYERGKFPLPVELNMAIGSGSHRTTGALKEFKLVIGKKPE